MYWVNYNPCCKKNYFSNISHFNLYNKFYTNIKSKISQYYTCYNIIVNIYYCFNFFNISDIYYILKNKFTRLCKARNVLFQFYVKHFKGRLTISSLIYFITKIVFCITLYVTFNDLPFPHV